MPGGDAAQKTLPPERDSNANQRPRESRLRRPVEPSVRQRVEILATAAFRPAPRASGLPTPRKCIEEKRRGLAQHVRVKHRCGDPARVELPDHRIDLVRNDDEVLSRASFLYDSLYAHLSRDEAPQPRLRCRISA
jgi:hypothetical protein